MIVEIHPNNPNPRQIKELVRLLKLNGLIIIPTDTIYAAVCTLDNMKVMESLAKKIGKKIHKTNFSILCSNFSQLSEYTKPIPNPIFKLMKSVLPGPYTFILKASRKLPHHFRENKKDIGIRISNHQIVTDLLEELNEPLLTTSIHNDDEVTEYYTDPYEIYKDFVTLVNRVVDGGPGGNIASTIIDCTTGIPQITRQGKGKIE